jgi:hypothetical protein
MTETIVRLANPQDEEGLMEHARMLHGENGLFPLSEQKAHGIILRALEKRGAIIGVIGDAGSLEASICLSLDQPYYSEAFQLTELWNFVAPPRHKRAGHAKRLIEFAKHCSDHMQLPLSVGILSNSRIEAKQRLYERQLEPAGVFFVHNRKLAGPSAWDGQG